MRALLPTHLPALVALALYGCDMAAPAVPATTAFVSPPHAGSIPEGQAPPPPPPEPYGHIPAELRTLPAAVIINVAGPYLAGWVPTTMPATGSFHERTTHEFALPALRGTCYRLIAVIFNYPDLELPHVGLEAHDATGLVEQDASYASVKLLGIRQPLCVSHDEVLRVRLSAARASGYFTLAIYHPPESTQSASTAPQVQPVPSYPTPSIDIE